MEIKDENKMIITDENGDEHTVTILFTYHHDERNKDYVLFVEDEDDEEVYAMSYTEDGELEIIEDDEEYEEIEEVLNAYQEENGFVVEEEENKD